MMKISDLQNVYDVLLSGNISVITDVNINSYNIWFMEACSVGIVLSFPIILYFTKKKICKN